MTGPLGGVDANCDWDDLTFDGGDLASPQPFSACLQFSFEPTNTVPVLRPDEPAAGSTAISTKWIVSICVAVVGCISAVLVIKRTKWWPLRSMPGFSLRLSTGKTVILLDGKRLTAADLPIQGHAAASVLAEVARNPHNAAVLGLKNLTGRPWTARVSSGALRTDRRGPLHPAGTRHADQLRWARGRGSVGWKGLTSRCRLSGRRRLGKSIHTANHGQRGVVAGAFFRGLGEPGSETRLHLVQAVVKDQLPDLGRKAGDRIGSFRVRVDVPVGASDDQGRWGVQERLEAAAELMPVARTTATLSRWRKDVDPLGGAGSQRPFRRHPPGRRLRVAQRQ